MRAAYFDRFGAAADVLRVGDIDEPKPRPGEVLVAIAASGINPSDVKRRAGWRAATAAPDRRVVAHCDGAGQVIALGDGVDPVWRDRRVWIWSIPGQTFARDGIEYGTAAERLAVPVAHLAPLPAGVDMALGACLGVPAITAHFTVFADGPVMGRTVLVQGGGGAVGEAAVQFARAAGARVIATARSEARTAIATAAGADVVIDPTTADAVERILAVAPGGVDRIIEVDFGANAALDAAVLRLGGMIVSYSSTSRPEPEIPYYALQRRAALIRLVSNYVLPPDSIRAATDAIGRALADGTLRPTIARRLPLADIAAAHGLVEAGVAGKVVLTL